MMISSGSVSKLGEVEVEPKFVRSVAVGGLYYINPGFLSVWSMKKQECLPPSPMPL